MKENALCLFVIFCFFAILLPAQTPCKAREIQEQAVKRWQTDQFSAAPDMLLDALPHLAACPEANTLRGDFYRQAGAWFTALEQFERAEKALDTAKTCYPDQPEQLAAVTLLQVRLALAARKYEQVKALLDDLFHAKNRLNEAHYAEALILRAKYCYYLTKPEEGIACLDSVQTLPIVSRTLALETEALATRVELDFIIGDLKQVVADAETCLEKTSEETGIFFQEIKCRLLETSGKAARSIIGTRAGHERLIQAQNVAESLPPSSRVRLLPIVLCQLLYSLLEQEGEDAAETAFVRLESMLDPARLSHQTVQAEAYTMRARIFNMLGQLEEAIAYAERSIALLNTLPGDNSQRLSANYLFMAASYRMMQDFEASLVNGEKALDLRIKLQPNHIGLASIYNDILNTALEMGDSNRSKTALLAFEQILENQKDKSNIEYFQYAISFGWLNYWRQVGQPLKGIQRAEDFLKTSGAKARMRGAITAEMEYKICDAYQEARQPKAAFDRLEPIVVRLKKRYLEAGNIFYEHYSWVLAQSAYMAIDCYEQSGDTAMLRIAAQRCLEAEDLLFALRNRDPHEGQRRFVTDEFLYKCLLRVRASLFLKNKDPWQVERAFAVSESFQLVNLQRVLSEKKALRFGGVDADAAALEKALQKEMANLASEKSGLRFQEPGPATDAKAALIEKNLLVAHFSYDSLLNDLEKKFPDYYKLKYTLPIVTLGKAQKELLLPGQCMLKIYAFTDTAICLLVRQDTSMICMTKFGIETEKALTVFTETLQDYPAISNLPEAAFAEKQQQFVTAANLLYTHLLAPLAPWLTPEILLMPHDMFRALPFEALLTAPATQLARPSAWSFWGKEKTISYSASATIFQFVQERHAYKANLKPALAMAPYFSGALALESPDALSRERADAFTPLPHTGEEVATVANLLSGTAYSGKECSVNSFIAQAEHYKVLHLATHAAAGGNGRPAFISFQASGNDWRSAMLFESNIYALNLSADLVTLSACKTALGKARLGDGLQGLTRAFTCAGARNVIASLWSVNDASTKALMIGLYQGIKSGKRYNQALVEAKRNFITENRQYAHPYFWAGFILNGR